LRLLLLGCDGEIDFGGSDDAALLPAGFLSCLEEDEGFG
jgi:hypothetical protein